MAVDKTTETEGPHHSIIGKEIPKGVMIYRIFGAFFFGAADKLQSALKREKEQPEVLILRMRKVMAMDATGLNALEDLYERLHRKGRHLLLSGPHTQPLLVMDKAGFLDRLGRETSARTSTEPWCVRKKSLVRYARRSTTDGHRTFQKLLLLERAGYLRAGKHRLLTAT
jgi:SulP family sulfate permease